MFTVPPMKNSDQASGDRTAITQEIEVTEKHGLMTLQKCNQKNLECRKFYRTNGPVFTGNKFQEKVKICRF